MKRARQFLRLSMTAGVATVIYDFVVSKTFNDHEKKCGSEPCPHSSNLPGSRQVEAGIKIGVKRATLDLPCPYSTHDPEAQIQMMERLAWRIQEIGKTQGLQTAEAMYRVCGQIISYARRNPMVVIAESSLPPARSPAP